MVGAMKYEHELPNGDIATRNSPKPYAWAVVVQDSGTWGVWRWSETQANAMTYAATLQRRGFDATVEEINNGQRV
jgi:hypothetical protein